MRLLALHGYRLDSDFDASVCFPMLKRHLRSAGAKQLVSEWPMRKSRGERLLQKMKEQKIG